MERKQPHQQPHHYGSLTRFECARKSSADITLITEHMSRTRTRTLFPSPLARLRDERLIPPFVVITRNKK